jgi:chorismate dehydratase
VNTPLRIAAIRFLNPAPLMWNFEHAPEAKNLARRYTLEQMTPSDCARALQENRADIGLIPIGAYPDSPGLTILPGCAIASLDSIRSLLLIIRSDAEQRTDQEPDIVAPAPAEMVRIRRVALDTASRTSALYTKILFRKYWQKEPEFVQHAPNLDGMLAVADAALLIGDPALFALRDRSARYKRTGQPLRYIDLGHLWHTAAGCAWVSAVWAARTEALQALSASELQTVIEDFTLSRDAGLRHIPELTEEWSTRLNIPAAIVETYLSRNIHYFLDASAVAGIERFFADAHELQLIQTRPELRWASAPPGRR